MYEDVLKIIEDFPAITSGEIISLMSKDLADKQYVYRGLYTLEKEGQIIRDDSHRLILNKNMTSFFQSILS